MALVYGFNPDKLASAALPHFAFSIEYQQKETDIEKIKDDVKTATAKGLENASEVAAKTAVRSYNKSGKFKLQLKVEGDKAIKKARSFTRDANGRFAAKASIDTGNIKETIEVIKSDAKHHLAQQAENISESSGFIMAAIGAFASQTTQKKKEAFHKEGAREIKSAKRAFGLIPEKCITTIAVAGTAFFVTRNIGDVLSRAKHSLGQTASTIFRQTSTVKERLGGLVKRIKERKTHDDKAIGSWLGRIGGGGAENFFKSIRTKIPLPHLAIGITIAAVAYKIYDAIRDTLMEIIELQDQLAESTASAGASWKEHWNDAMKAGGIMLDLQAGVDLVSGMASYGSHALKASNILLPVAAKSRALGLDIMSDETIKEGIASFAHAFGKQGVEVWGDLVYRLYDIRQAPLRGSAMRIIAERASWYGTQSEGWFSNFSSGVIRSTLYLERMGLRTTAIEKTLADLVDYNPYNIESRWNNIIMQYGGMYAANLAAMGDHSAAMDSMRHFAQDNETKLKNPLGIKYLMAKFSLDREQIETLQALLNGNQDAAIAALKGGVKDNDEQNQLAEFFDKRMGTIQKKWAEIGMSWKLILLRVADEFIRPLDTFIHAIERFIEKEVHIDRLTILAEKMATGFQHGLVALTSGLESLTIAMASVTRNKVMRQDLEKQAASLSIQRDQIEKGDFSAFSLSKQDTISLTAESSEEIVQSNKDAASLELVTDQLPLDLKDPKKMFKTYLTIQEEAKLAAGGKSSYQMALMALRRQAKDKEYASEGNQKENYSKPKEFLKRQPRLKEILIDNDIKRALRTTATEEFDLKKYAGSVTGFGIIGRASAISQIEVVKSSFEKQVVEQVKDGSLSNAVRKSTKALVSEQREMFNGRVWDVVSKAIQTKIRDRLPELFTSIDKQINLLAKGSQEVWEKINELKSIASSFTRKAGNSLGWLSAKYESGAAGPGAIGFDSKGGTSYGTYQIATRPGTMRNFLKFLGRKYPVIHKMLVKAGSSETGIRSPFADAWRGLARTIPDAFGAMQHEFIRMTHFDIAAKKLTQAGIDINRMSQIMAEILWSTAVQHGPGGATSIFRKAYKEDGGEPEIIRRIYALRGTKFGSSTEAVRASVLQRFQNEEQRALAVFQGHDQRDIVNRTEIKRRQQKILTSSERRAKKINNYQQILTYTTGWLTNLEETSNYWKIRLNKNTYQRMQKQVNRDVHRLMGKTV